MRFGEFARLCWSAALYRYVENRWRGSVLLFVSILDVVVYASILYAVVEAVFGLGGLNRFVPTIIGLVALRWSLSCAIQASRTAHFARLFQSSIRRPVLSSVVLAVAGPTLVFIAFVILFLTVLVLSVRGPSDLIQMFGWGVVVAFIQLLWNCVLALTIIHIRLRGYLLSEMPIMFGFLLLLVISPVAYQFGDIPSSASLMLTSLNPAAHLIAGYQNAFWYVQDISLEALPLSALFAVVLVVLLGRSLQNILESPRERPDEAQMCLGWNGRGWSSVTEQPSCDDTDWYTRWDGELPWLTGANIFYLIDSSSSARNSKNHIFSALSGESDGDRLMMMPLPLLSHIHRDRLCVAIALGTASESPEPRDNVAQLWAVNQVEIVLDGLLDQADVHELQELSKILKSRELLSVLVLTDRGRTAQALANMTDDQNIGIDAER